MLQMEEYVRVVDGCSHYADEDGLNSRTANPDRAPTGFTTSSKLAFDACQSYGQDLHALAGLETTTCRSWKKHVPKSLAPRHGERMFIARITSLDDI